MNIKLSSDSIGDTIASMPYISKFIEDGNMVENVSINPKLIPFFFKSYNNINLIGRDETKKYDKVLDYIFTESVQFGYAKQLGYENPKYIKPIIDFEIKERPVKNKFVAIGVHSTAQLKYWNHPLGKKAQPYSLYWNEVCSFLRKKNYTPIVLEKDELFGIDDYKNGIPSKAVKKIGQTLEETINYIYHSDFYIGLSSGVSWVAHAIGKPVIMIANFTEDWNEFDLNISDYYRITNKNVCHGCWNEGLKFDASDWYWCPKHKNTDRQFECHKSITPEMVINKIEELLSKKTN